MNKERIINALIAAAVAGVIAFLGALLDSIKGGPTTMETIKTIIAAVGIAKFIV